MFLLYNILITVFAPIWAPWMWLRTRVRKEQPIWTERFGNYELKPRKDRQRVWNGPTEDLTENRPAGIEVIERQRVEPRGQVHHELDAFREGSRFRRSGPKTLLVAHGVDAGTACLGHDHSPAPSESFHRPPRPLRNSGAFMARRASARRRTRRRPRRQA